MPRRIRKIEYDRIDRVDAGAQPDAHITLVKRRVKIEKLIDPASIDARVQAVRDEFREQYSGSYGCCSPCSGYVYVDAVYDAFVIACDSDGSYWQFSYTQDAEGDVEFGTPEAVKPSVKWSADASEDDMPPVPVVKSKKPLWTASNAERVQRANKEKSKPMPKTPVKKTAAALPDLSALDDAAREAVEAAFAENATLTEAAAEFEAAVAAQPEPTVADDVDDDEDLSTIDGIQKALKKTRSPEMKRLLKATLTRLEKAEADNASLREQTTRLEKAERIRLFKSRAEAVPHMAAHATEAGGDSVGELADLLEQVDASGGSELCERVEKMLTKANAQVTELAKPLLKSLGRVGGAAPGMAVVLGTSDDPEYALAEMEAAIAKEHPDLSNAQVKTRVLKSDKGRQLYAAAEAAKVG